MTSQLLDKDTMQAWRHQIHQQPELGFEEHATSQLVAENLRQWGYEVTTGLAVTGVVGKMVFGDGKGPSIGLRADMDALPLQEQTGLPWQSQHSGKMHACGHDGHTAMLLGAAKALAGLREQANCSLNGALIMIFQPAEEVGGGGGAQRMLDEGLFTLFPCDEIYALHNFPGIPVGQCVFRPGPFMCSSDKVSIQIKGKGGHGGLPQLAIDPTPPLAAIVMGLQAIVARNLDPLDTGVVSIGRLQAGTTYNIIPETSQLELSVRALQPHARKRLHERIKTLCEQTVSAYECEAEVLIEEGYPVLINHLSAVQRIASAAKSVFGQDGVDDQGRPLTGSEDFAYMLQAVPGCYVLIGNGDNGYTKGQPLAGPCSVHNPHYDFNDEILMQGAQLWVQLITEAFRTR
jgi:hippurate hydrolase